MQKFPLESHADAHNHTSSFVWSSLQGPSNSSCPDTYTKVMLKVPYHKKHVFSALLSTYISWSSLSVPTHRMRKTSHSCMVSAVHPLVTRCSYRLFRFSSCRYVTKGVIIIIAPPPLRGDRRYQRGGRSSPRWSSVCPAKRQQCFAMSSLRARHAIALLLVV